jgi:hypothetical protein
MPTRSGESTAGREFEGIESWLQAITGSMRPEDRRRLIELAVVLGSSATRRSLDVLLGASPAEVAEVVSWAVKRLAATSAGE